MQLLHQLRRNGLRIIGLLIIELIAGIVVYVRRPIKPEEYAVYEAATDPDHILFYETAEGINLDSELAAQSPLHRNGEGWPERPG